MKSINILWTSLAAMAMLLSGCNDEEEGTGLDESLPCPAELMYDEFVSNSNSITLTWKKGDAGNAGATSYTVQLADENLGAVDQYDGTFSQTIQAGKDMSYSFEGAVAYKLYYARVRANYPGSRFSKWVYINLGSKDKKYAVELGYGLVDSDLPGLDGMTYLSSTSTSTSASFAVDASTAMASSAADYLVLMQSKKSSIANATATVPSTEASVTVSGLTAKNRYFVRGRASYQVNGYTVYSPWFQASEEINGKTCYVFEAGKGAVEELPPIVRFDKATSSALYFSWSSNNFEDVDSDDATPWTLSLYEDEACTDLVISWNLDSNQDDGISKGTQSIWDSKQTRFVFTGLKPSTKYYLKVTDKNSELTSDAAEGETEAFEVVTISSNKAAEGDVVLAEDFSELIWGGDMVWDYPGYSSSNKNTLTSFEKAEGSAPADHYKFVKASNEIGLFNTMAPAVASSRLKTWGAIFEGPATSYVLGRAGYIKLGASNYMAQIATPVLSSLPGTCTVRLSFKAARYESDALTAQVQLVSSSTVGEQNAITPGASSVIAKFSVPEEKGVWKEYSFDIENVTPDSRIAIGTTREDGSVAGKSQHRMYVDDITVKVLSVGGSVISLSAPVIGDLSSTSDKITVNWAAVDNASGYSVEYKKSSASEWTVAGSTAETTYEITGLDPETSYEVRVQATASGDNKSDYSEVKTISTTEKPKALDLKLVHSEANVLVVRWSVSEFGDAASDREDAYQFGVFKDAACTDPVVFYKGGSDEGYSFGTDTKMTGYRSGKAEYDESPAFVFAGLKPSTTYYVKVVDVTKNISGVKSFATTSSKVVDLRTLVIGSAEAGSVILNEDFGDITWGGDLEHNAAGVSSRNRFNYTSFSMPSGEVSYTTSDKTKQDYYLTGAGTEMGLFNTVNNAVQSTRLYSWGWRAVDDNIGSICARPGSIKLGAGSKSGIILTPVLSALRGPATVKVTVTAGCYIDVGATADADALNGEVTLYDGSSVELKSTSITDADKNKFSTQSKYIPVATAPKATSEFTVDAKRGYKDYVITLSGVTPSDVIGIGAPTSSYNRLMIDNIKIEVVKYE